MSSPDSSPVGGGCLLYTGEPAATMTTAAGTGNDVNGVPCGR